MTAMKRALNRSNKLQRWAFFNSKQVVAITVKIKSPTMLSVIPETCLRCQVAFKESLKYSQRASLRREGHLEWSRSKSYIIILIRELRKDMRIRKLHKLDSVNSMEMRATLNFKEAVCLCSILVLKSTLTCNLSTQAAPTSMRIYKWDSTRRESFSQVEAMAKNLMLSNLKAIIKGYSLIQHTLSVMATQIVR